ncbi:glycoside hydrolase family 127 protein [Sphingobacterium sp. SG20118]|uniref:glycoside hydrolase family 127 protein n=1 Tax=Sphingobacterium sp. SG20118 TaxID=3367156 RepID=UPI0037DFBE6A
MMINKKNKGAILLLALALSSSVVAQEKLYHHTFDLGDVKLLESPFLHAQNLNVETLLEYDVDRLLAPFLKEAGIEPKAPSFTNWIDLDGHVGGHYLSALAIHYASTGDVRCKERMEYMLAELKRCQDKNGDGYLGGVPNGENLWKEVKKGNVGEVWKYWVPWYNLHKTYAGLRDAWLYGNNEEAKDMFIKLSNWGANLVAALSDEEMESMLGNEFGGMNEVYADAYQITGDERYLTTAKRFSHKQIFDSVSKRVDNLDNMHANTQVPKAVGYQRVAELTKEEDYTVAADFFWDIVSQNRSLSLGGNSRREHFPSQQDFLSYMEEREGPESCNTNNMLKLAGGLFRMNPDVKYMDFYEKALYNHILSTQHPEHGGYVYFTSARPAHYRVYSQVNSAMWCCVGTGMENHGKYGEMIYTHDEEALYINLFVASKLDWEEKGIKLTQHTDFPASGKSTLTIDEIKSTTAKVLVRYPTWISAGKMKVIVGGKDYAASSQPGSYIVIDRKWQKGDKIEVDMAMEFRVEELKHQPEYISIFRGPILMGSKIDKGDLSGLVADDHRWGHIAHGFFGVFI